MKTFCKTLHFFLMGNYWNLRSEQNKSTSQFSIPTHMKSLIKYSFILQCNWTTCLKVWILCRVVILNSANARPSVILIFYFLSFISLNRMDSLSKKVHRRAQCCHLLLVIQNTTTVFVQISECLGDKVQLPGQTSDHDLETMLVNNGRRSWIKSIIHGLFFTAWQS